MMTDNNRLIGFVLNSDYPKGAEEERQRYNAKLERFNRLAVGRESKMIELKIREAKKE